MARLDAYRLNTHAYQMSFWDGNKLEPHLEHLGIQFASLQALFQGGILSFEPTRGMDLSPVDLGELCFLAPFVRQQLDVDTIGRLLKALDPPYNYDHQLIYLNWRTCTWHPYPSIDLFEVMSDLKNQAWKAQDIKGLKVMGFQLKAALEDVKSSITAIESAAG